MIGPALFVGTFTLEGWLRPGYDALGMYVSALSLGPRGWIQRANFIVFGILFLVFVRRVSAEFEYGKASKAGPLLLTIIGVSLLASGLFAMDPAATPRESMSVRGTLHGIFGALVFSLMPVSCFVFLRRFREDSKWQSFQWWTLAAATIVATSVVVLSIVTKLPAMPYAFTAWVGLIQRAALVPYMVWLFSFALRLS
jgi:Protein of unknown function (DUF998)